MNSASKKIISAIIVVILIISGLFLYYNYEQTKNPKEHKSNEIKYVPVDEKATVLSFDYFFSAPEVKEFEEVVNVYVEEADLNMIGDGRPVLPVNLTVLEFPFGTKITNFEFYVSDSQTIEIPKMLAYGSYSPKTEEYEEYYSLEELYPYDWVTYHKGGGLNSELERKTFFVIRNYPVRYLPSENKLEYIESAKIFVEYLEPEQELIPEKNEYDLLIITPNSFTKKLQPLVNHKNSNDVKTKMVTVENIYKEISEGCDQQEKIKYYIKSAVEDLGIKYCLLVGAIKGQTDKWNLPIRRSHVIPPTEQEFPEKSFITDLYFADIYDSEGEFSSWNTNGNNIFSEWNEDGQDEMDLYPDLFVGRLPCRNTYEVKTMVDKIINYEKSDTDSTNWFKKIILVGGDSYNDTNQYNEGEMICDKSLELLPGFNPVKVYASEMTVDHKTINNAINGGAGFAYFCGHGSATAWGTHYPPDGIKWTEFYDTIYMNFFKNKEKLPIAVIGGCLNGNFDMSVAQNIKTGFEKESFKYFLKNFWLSGWRGHCWAWKLTSSKSGGMIATISNTGLGTHGRDDNDHNGVIDYLEVINGWQELRFLEIYGQEGKDILGENHGQTITEYLHRFYGNHDKMDIKMAQQWFLFGDPSLKIGGY